MVIEMIKTSPEERDICELHRELAEKNACYVLITCCEPNADGKIQVEMIHGGDTSLAAYLLESARGFLE